MAVRYENDCCGCATDSYPCLGSACPNRNVPYYSCDQCGDEGDIYEYEGQHYCADCLLALFEKVQEG